MVGQQNLAISGAALPSPQVSSCPLPVTKAPLFTSGRICWPVLQVTCWIMLDTSAWIVAMHPKEKFYFGNQFSCRLSFQQELYFHAAKNTECRLLILHLLILPGSDSWKSGPLNPGGSPLQESREPHDPGNNLSPFLSPVGRAACLWGTSFFVYRIGIGRILLSKDQESVLNGCSTAIERIQGPQGWGA